jgi:hypothetical protein
MCGQVVEVSKTAPKGRITKLNQQWSIRATHIGPFFLAVPEVTAQECENYQSRFLYLEGADVLNDCRTRNQPTA